MSVSKSGVEPGLVESLQAVVFPLLLPVGQLFLGQLQEAQVCCRAEVV